MARPNAHPHDESQLISSVLFQYEKAFKAGQNPDPGSFLQGTGQTRSRLLLELLHSDVELRLRAGQSVRVLDYLRRFPELGKQPQDLASLVETEIRLLHQLGKKTDQKQYELEYGEILGKQVRELFARLATAQNPSSTAEDAAETKVYEHKPVPQRSEKQPERIGRFEIIALLGKGAFGRVYRARDPELEREVAIKVPRLQNDDPFDVQQFLREAKAAATIRHPNVCPVYEAGVQDGQPYIVMAYIPGKSLAEVLEHRGPPPGKQVALIIRKLALALQAAHDKGVVHRDLKPSNILFDQQRKDVVITDFGLARRDDLDEAGQTRTGVIMGTPAYMSPEQARGESRSVGPAADIYSLGVVLFELLTGQTPFTGSVREVLHLVQDLEPLPPSARRDGVDEHLEAICLKAMAKNPGERFSSMRAVAEALQEYLRGSAADTALNSATRSTTTAQDTTGFADLIASALAEQKAEMAAAVEAAVSKARIAPWKIYLPMGLLAVFGLAMLGLYLFTKPETVALTLQLDVDIRDKELSFFLDDKPIEAEKLAGPIELSVGKHVLIVKHGKTVIRRYEFDVKRGMDPVLRPQDVVPPWPMSPGVPPATVHYPLDGQGQAMLNDARRRASGGKIAGEVQSVPGIISQAAGLEGKADQHLEINDTDALHITQLFTAAAWVKGKGQGATLLSRWNEKGYAFRLSATSAKGVEPKGDIAPAMMMPPGGAAPTKPMPATSEPSKHVPAAPGGNQPKPATPTPPQAMSGPDSLLASTFTLLSHPSQPPASTTPSEPKGNQKTSVIEFAVNFGPKDKAENAIVLRATYDPEAWTHVAATFDGHFLRLYLNGYQSAELMLADDPTFRKLMDEGKASLPTSIASSTAPLVMGQGFNGLIDDVMLFDAALNPKELMRLIHFNTIRELATPPGQWVNLAADESDLERAKLTGKLGENIQFIPYLSNALQLERKGQVRFPVRARNYVVRGVLHRLEKAGGLVRLRQDDNNSYGGYFTGDGRFGLIKETNGRAVDLASNQTSLTQFTATRSKAIEENGRKMMTTYSVALINPTSIAFAVHGDRLAWFLHQASFLERKDEALKSGTVSLAAMDDGAVEISGWQVCVLDGTPFTPEEAIYRDKSRFTIKPVFCRLVSLDEAQQLATLEEIYTEYVQKQVIETVMKKERVKELTTEMRMENGKQVPHQVEHTVEKQVPVQETRTLSIPVQKQVCFIVSIAGSRVTDARGNPMKMADLVKWLKPGDACLRLSSDKLAPAHPYLLKTKPETVVFMESSSSQAPPAETSEPKTMPPAEVVPNVKPPVAESPAVKSPAASAPTQLTGHANPIQTVVHSPDGSQIATADGTFWKPGMTMLRLEANHMSSGQTTVFPAKESGPDCTDYYAATSSDGKRMAVNEFGMLPISLWDIASNKVVLTIPGGKQPLTALAMSSDGMLIASAGHDYTRPFQQPQPVAPKADQPRFELKIWDAATGKQLHDMKGLTHPVLQLAFSPDGRRLISSDQSGTLRIWDVASGEEHLSIVNDEGIQTRAMAISNKLVALACSGKDNSMIRLINPETGAQVIKIPAKTTKADDGKNVTAYFSQVAFSHDGKKLITCESNIDKGMGANQGWQDAQKDKGNVVRVYDADTGRELQQMDVGKVDRTIVVSPDGTHFAARYSPTTPEETIKVWNLATGMAVSSITGRFWSVLAVKNNGTQVIATRYVEKVNDYPPLSVKLWSASTGAVLRSFEAPGNGIVSIAYSGDGKRIAAGICTIDMTKPQYFVGELRVWDAATGAEIQTIKGIDGWIMGVGLDQTGKRAATVSGMESKVWNVETGKALHSFPGGSRMAMDPAGKVLVVSGGFGPPPAAGQVAPKPVRVFSCEDGKELPGLDVPGSVHALAISHNGVVLATASSDGIRSWNLQTGKELRIYPANVGHMFFDAAGLRLTTANSRSTFTIRHASTGRAQSRLRLNPKVPSDASPVHQMFAMGFGYDARGIPMSISPDGKTLAVVSLDGKSVQLKPVASLEPAENEDIAPEEKAMQDQAPVAVPAVVPSQPAQPAASKPVETKPAETKPAETKPAETKPAESKPPETKPTESKPAESKATESKPAESKPAESKPAATKPVGVLLNGSFEEGEKSWTSSSWRGNKSAATIVSDVSKSGKAVRLQATIADDAGYWQEVAVKPRTRYRLSAWMRTEDVKVVEKGGAVGATISLRGRPAMSPSTVGTTDWTLKTLEFNSGNRQVVQLGAHLGNNSSTVTGTAWFDDFKLEELPPVPGAGKKK